MKIEDLKQGDTIFLVEDFSALSYKYLCVHPNNKSYHIIIDDNQEPIRWHKGKLEAILSLNLKSLPDTELFLAQILEEEAKFIRELALQKLNHVAK